MTELIPNLSRPTCRVCLKNNQLEEMSSIFDVDSDICDLHIYEKIEQCAGIEVLRDDKLPTMICGDCYGLLKTSYKFRTVCRNSEEYLKDFIAKGLLVSQKTENHFEENPLSVFEKNDKNKTTNAGYKNKLRDRTDQLPPTIKNERTSPPQSLESEEVISDFDDKFDDDEVWFDIDYKDDEDDLSCGENIEIEIKQEIEEPRKATKIKSRKKSNAKEKKVTAPSKTLEISPDGAAIIRKKRTRAKREKKEKQLHICEICGNMYQRHHSLQYHMKRHRDEKPFECEICSYAFYSNFELIRHMRKHTGSKPYNCSYCPRAFGDRSTLIKHERVHRNERPFKCETCGKSFSYTGVLKCHKLIHTGERPYSCEICGKSFPQAHKLRDHLKTLQHQNDPRIEMLLQNIKKNSEPPLL